MNYIVTIIRWLFLAVFLFLVANGKVMLWLGLFAVSLPVALLFGRVYCGYVCPMNTLMIPADRLSHRLEIKRKGAPIFLLSGKFAWVALLISIAAVIITRKIWHINLPILPIWLIIALFAAFKYNPAMFHNLICPFGALQRTFGRYALFSRRVSEEDCAGCKLCEKVCPTGAIAVDASQEKAAINTALCFQCSNCSEVCNKEAINYIKA